MKIEPGAGGGIATPPATKPRVNPDDAAKKPDREASRQTYNKAILASSMEVSLSSGNQALGLLYKSAIESLNKVLGPEFGDNAIQNAYDSGLDVSPEATAGRIVSLSTAFFGQYRESNPHKDLETAIRDFTQLISGGVEKGFAEARHILDGLGVLQGDIAANIDRTFELVQSGLQAFMDSYGQPTEAGASAGDTADTGDAAT